MTGLNPDFATTVHEKRRKGRENIKRGLIQQNAHLRLKVEVMEKDMADMRRELVNEGRQRGLRLVYAPDVENPNAMIDGKTKSDVIRAMARIIRRRSTRGLSTCEADFDEKFTRAQIDLCACHAAVLAVWRRAQDKGLPKGLGGIADD